MSKKDIPLLVLLIAMWIAWPHIYKRFFAPPAPPAEEASQTVRVTATGGAGEDAPALTAPPAVTEPAAPATPVPEAPPPPVEEVPERRVHLADEAVELTVTSRGAAIQQVVLQRYQESVEGDSGPVVLDFATQPALAYDRLPGIVPGSSFTVEEVDPGREVRLTRTAGALRLARTLRLAEGYLVQVEDELTNLGTTHLQLGDYHIELGPMRNLASDAAMRGMVYLGADTLLQAGQGVKHWGKKLPKWFEKGGPHQVERPIQQAAEWIAAKNKFFVQILTPDDGLEDCLVRATREADGGAVTEVSVVGVFPAMELPAGQSYTREATFYVGPKKYAELKKYGLHQVDVMEFFLAPIAKFLLTVMNFIHDHIWPHNYGLAIMLLTIIIRVIFWPLTHKGTENMKRMQELQPLMKEIREKFKDNAQKQQQEMMALYKKHKVNPMMGCLPMLIQIPVFIALFYVLRSAIELRHADFLWVQDLSAPERLVEFGFTIPLLGWDALNILPLLMAASTLIQQRLTPTAGDPSQQKIMMFMPFMMLFFLYNFASGLVLYWTTNNVLMIAQQLWQRRKSGAKTASEK